MPTQPRAIDRRPRTRCSGMIRLAAVMLTCGALVGARPQEATAAINVWTSGGPEGVVVNALAVDPAAPETVYAGTAGHGVFKSVDHGATWAAANVGLGDIYVEFVAVDPGRPGTLYAASTNHGVFKSIDSAATWTAANTGLTSSAAGPLAFDAVSATLCVGSKDGVFKSVDGADTWMPTALLVDQEPSSPGEVPLHASIDCLAVDPTSGAIYACYFSWPTAPALSWVLLKSVDGGASWQAVALPTAGGPVAIAIDAATGALHVATFDPYAPAYEVMTSADAGETWTPTGLLPGCAGECRIGSLAVDASSPATLYAGTDHGVYRTVDGGGWRPENTGLAGQSVTSLAIDPTDASIAYAGTSHGVFAIQQAPGCSGDCDGDAVVTVAEVIAMVGIEQGAASMQACAAGDVDRDGVISVNDLIGAIDSALGGCQVR